jgi:hypothetical protein
VLEIAKKKGFNPYRICGDVTEFYIVNRKGEEFIVLIDTDDLQKFIDADYRWHVTYAPNAKDYYVQTCLYEKANGKSVYKGTLYIENFIMCRGNGIQVDHENHIATDNRKINLRVTTNDKNTKHRRGLNSNNSSGYRNVSIINGKPIVQLQDNGKNHVWRNFITVEEAAEFAAKMRKELYGEFSGE